MSNLTETKSIQQIQQEADERQKAFHKELKEIRKYQDTHPTIKESFGGYVLDLGTDRHASKKAKHTPQ